MYDVGKSGRVALRLAESKGIAAFANRGFPVAERLGHVPRTQEIEGVILLHGVRWCPALRRLKLE